MMDLSVCQVTSALSVVVNTAPGLRFLIRRSTRSDTCCGSAAGVARINPTWKKQWNNKIELSHLSLTMKETSSGSEDEGIEIILFTRVVINS